MRRLLIVPAVTAVLLAIGSGPAAALTISSAPNRDQAQHLRQAPRLQTGRTPVAGDVSLRDSWAADQRPMGGAYGFSADDLYGDSQTFRFGDVTTTVTRDPEADLRRPAYVPGRPVYLAPEWVSRRR